LAKSALAEGQERGRCTLCMQSKESQQVAPQSICTPLLKLYTELHEFGYMQPFVQSKQSLLTGSARESMSLMESMGLIIHALITTATTPRTMHICTRATPWWCIH